MHTSIQLAERGSNRRPIPRSLRASAEYVPHWRFLVFQQYLEEIAGSKDEGALNEILAREPDRIIKALLRFEFGGSCRWSEAIGYALDCHRSQHSNRIAAMISAMVVAGRTSAEIAEEIASDRRHVIAYEFLFFDVRRYLENRYWIKDLCYSHQRITTLNERAGRWLITACERGWPGLSDTFSTARANSAPAGQRALETFALRIASRCSDYVTLRDQAGMVPDGHDLELLLRFVSLQRELPASLQQLDYPTPISLAEAKAAREAAEAVGKLSPAARERIGIMLARVKASAEAGVKPSPTNKC